MLHEDRNRTAGGDETLHPELELARWAAAHVAPDVRPRCTVYTSGEHCPMCSAGHAWVGLGRIVYAASTEQLTALAAGLGARPPGPVAPLPITRSRPGLPVAGRRPSWPRSCASCTTGRRRARPGRVGVRGGGYQGVPPPCDRA